MKNLSNILIWIFSLVILGGFGYFTYKVVELTVLNLDKININIIIAIIGGTITISSFFITRYLEKKKIIELEIRNKKIPIYEEFFEFYFLIILGKKEGKTMPQKDMVKFFREFNTKAIVWFPESSLLSYLKWKKELIEFSNNSENSERLKNIFLVQEELMKQLRKDIGHEDKNLKPGDLSSLFINDIDKYI
ncbi:MAG: hypothetical protein CML16_05450 [Pusillimonas sp.]|nr:hypothetical protein [Pusillimonas sp.]|tara:strand:+ start:8503 stop:9075 length:573 start_codon:yes stop_codon:yes gene_type:complete